MDSTFPLQPPVFSPLPDDESKLRRKKLVRRLITATLLALGIHFLFFLVVYPYLSHLPKRQQLTEVTQISPDEVARIKKANERSRYVPPLLQQELREEFKTKDKPKDARFIAPFNQVVPEETVAGAQPDAPEKGGGGQKAAKSQARTQTKREAAPDLKLSRLGLGNSVPKPLPQENQPAPISPIQGPAGPHRPVGREDPRLKKSGENMLNAVENEYYSFFTRFEEPIIRNWYFLLRNMESKIRQEFTQKKMGDGAELPVTVEFTIDRQGNFVAINLIRSSGIPTLDSSTLEAVRKLRTLPNPPPGIFDGGSTFTYRLQFMVYLTNAPMVESAPGMNWY